MDEVKDEKRKVNEKEGKEEIKYKLKPLEI